MPDVGLGGTDQQWPVRVTAAPVRGRGRLHLDRVTERSAGAVRLQVVHVPTAEPGAVQSGGDETLLGTTIGDGQTAGGTVLVHRAAADHRADPVPVALGVGEPLEHQHTAALTADVTVGGRVEGLAAAVRRQHPRL